ncbi:MAG: hypothetical protein JXB00_06270 [Bacteroidales bacterium]|nr:hypothetical protein [Bacteroidales bacterium]
METLFEGKSCKAEYIKEKKLVFYTLTGYADVEEHKKMYIKVFDFMQSNKIVAFLHDL